MRERNTKLHMSALLPLGVFALFAVCVLSVLLTGGSGPTWPCICP